MLMTEIDRNSAVVGDDGQQYRAGAYDLLAALLRAEPGDEVLARAAGLDGVAGSSELEAAMAALGLAARSFSAAEAAREYFDLFIGIGRGELVPYGSWYQTGFLMERPLSDLRNDLAEMGFARDPSVCEPEDHVAALCEVMSMLCLESADPDRERRFYRRHLAPWVGRFYADLGAAKGARFYRSVARFGAAFSAFEARYLEMDV